MPLVQVLELSVEAGLNEDRDKHHSAGVRPKGQYWRNWQLADMNAGSLSCAISPKAS